MGVELLGEGRRGQAFSILFLSYGRISSLLSRSGSPSPSLGGAADHHYQSIFVHSVNALTDSVPNPGDAPPVCRVLCWPSCAPCEGSEIFPYLGAKMLPVIVSWMLAEDPRPRGAEPCDPEIKGGIFRLQRAPAGDTDTGSD